MSDEDFLIEIQDGFLQEAADLLNRVEALSLSLEKNPSSEDTYAELARLAHNFKGSGKAVGFEHISKIGHRLEDFILAIKNKKIPSNPEQLDFLFSCLDRLRKDVEVLILDKKKDLDYANLFEEISLRLEKKYEIEMEGPTEADNAIVHPPQTLVKEVEELKTVKQEPSFQKKQNPIPAPNSKATQIEVLRIQKPKIDYLLEAFGEQVIMQSALEQCKGDVVANQEILVKTITQLTKLTFELQSHALSLTMIQLGPTFTKLERAIRDAAKVCNKNIEINMIGSETEVDKVLIDSLSDSLIHMVRNSVDHAIEDAADRIIAGKPEVGTITVKAERSGGQLWVEVRDDGKGLDPVALKNKAIEKGLISELEAQSLTNTEAFNLIFKSGFSTKENVSEVSGRGVGMNVVVEAVTALKGRIEILSEIGKGTTFRMKLPLSLAIFNGAVIRVNKNKFIVPNSDIAEIGLIDILQKAQVNNDKDVIKIRNELFEVIDLRQKLGPQVESIAHNNLSKKIELPVLISKKSGNFAFIIDEILGMQKIVQKPLGEEVKLHSEYSAGTILSDGSPGVVINLNSFTNH